MFHLWWLFCLLLFNISLLLFISFSSFSFDRCFNCRLLELWNLLSSLASIYDKLVRYSNLTRLSLRGLFRSRVNLNFYKRLSFIMNYFIRSLSIAIISLRFFIFNLFYFHFLLVLLLFLIQSCFC